MEHKYYMLWTGAAGGQFWAGPFETIDDAHARVPDTARASMIAVPLRAMTPAERREALPILEGQP